MKTVILNKKEFKQVASFLFQGCIVVFPTETVMGIAVVADNYDSYKQLIDVKNRPLEKAFPLVVGNKKQISDYAIINDKQKRIIEKLMPGPLTIVLKKKNNVPSYVTAGKDSIAIRMSDDEFVLKVLKDLGKPILLTSANLSGEPSSLNDEEAQKIFYGKVRAIVQGDCPIQIPSTIVDLTATEPKILREGIVSIDQINEIWRE